MTLDTQNESQSIQPANEALKKVFSSNLDKAIISAKSKLLHQQSDDGHWVYELEADCTIPAEYILMNHFTGEVDDEKEERIAEYLRARQNEEGGWSLYTGGNSDLSCSVKVYFALKLVGDDPHEEHMIRAKTMILSYGGAAHCNVFTRITMALFEQVPWRATPFIPAEVIILPKWFPFHINKVSYWSRTVMVPLFVLCTIKPSASNPRGIDIRELFTTAPEDELNYFKITTPLKRVFLILDHIGRLIEKLVPRFVRQYSIRKCEQWFLERMNDKHGIGGIFPAMVNVYESLVVLGYPKDNSKRKLARQAIDALLIEIDGTENKSKYGANAMLGISMACAVVSANFYNQPLYVYLNKDSTIMPIPMINVLNGGMHANRGSDIQEIMLFPCGAVSFSESMRMGSEIFHTLKKELNNLGIFQENENAVKIIEWPSLIKIPISDKLEIHLDYAKHDSERKLKLLRTGKWKNFK